MPFFHFNWTPDAEAHLAEHGVTIAQFEAVIKNPDFTEKSRSSDRMIAFGSVDGERLCCIYEQFGLVFIDPVTAYFFED